MPPRDARGDSREARGDFAVPPGWLRVGFCYHDGPRSHSTARLGFTVLLFQFLEERLDPLDRGFSGSRMITA